MEPPKLPKGFSAWEGPVFKSNHYPPHVFDQTRVVVILRCGIEYIDYAVNIGWLHNPVNEQYQVVGYRILSGGTNC